MEGGDDSGGGDTVQGGGDLGSRHFCSICSSLRCVALSMIWYVEAWSVCLLMVVMMMMLMVTIFHLIYLSVYAHSDPKAHSQARIKRQDIGCYTSYPSPKLVRAALVGTTPTIIHEQAMRNRSHRNELAASGSDRALETLRIAGLVLWNS